MVDGYPGIQNETNVVGVLRMEHCKAAISYLLNYILEAKHSFSQLRANIGNIK